MPEGSRGTHWRATISASVAVVCHSRSIDHLFARCWNLSCFRFVTSALIHRLLKMTDPSFVIEPSASRPRVAHAAVALLFSALSHLVVLPLIRLPATSSLNETSAVLITLATKPRTSTRDRVSQPVPVPASQAASPEEIKAATIPSAPKDFPATYPVTQDLSRDLSAASDTVTPNLNHLFRDQLRQIAGKTSAKEHQGKRKTDNGAVVLDSELLTALNSASVASPIADASTSSEVSSFQGGAWQQLVNINGQCFRVVAANPLEPGSVEMWYPRRCPS
jgi:hypothetical protein